MMSNKEWLVNQVFEMSDDFSELVKRFSAIKCALERFEEDEPNIYDECVEEVKYFEDIFLLLEKKLED